MVLPIYIGYDSRETAAYHVLSHSILRRSSIPVSIHPVMLQHLQGVFNRTKGATETTEFSMSRFMVPYLSRYEGWSVFMDCDILCLTDVKELQGIALENADKAVVVCKHDYVPKSTTKFLGQGQTTYPRKNWSSVMLLNNAKCRSLTPEYVNTATGAELHRFSWVNDSDVGEMPLTYNWLVEEYAPNADAKLLHFTLGGPWFTETTNCEHADLWRAELAHMLGA